MAEQTYSIGEVSQRTGLPASTLRYYESVGIIGPIARGQHSKQRQYSQHDLETIELLSCLQSLDFSLADIRSYLAHYPGDTPADIASQVALFQRQVTRFQRQQELLALRAQYVGLKVEFWQARARGDATAATEYGTQARALIPQLLALTQQAAERS